MAYGDFLDLSPVERSSLKSVLEDVERRLNNIEQSPPSNRNFLFTTTQPTNDLGADGDAALDESTGYIWKKLNGAWTNTNFSLWAD